MAEGSFCWGGGGGGGRGYKRWESCQISMLHPPSLQGKHWHVLDIKYKSVNIDVLFRNKNFGLQYLFL